MKKFLLQSKAALSFLLLIVADRLCHLQSLVNTEKQHQNVAPCLGYISYDTELLSFLNCTNKKTKEKSN